MRYYWTVGLMVVALTTMEAQGQEATGGCCQTGGSCVVTADCNTINGHRLYLGDGSDCSGCLAALGACCFNQFGVGLSCIESRTQENCEIGLAGTHHGAGSICADVANTEGCFEPDVCPDTAPNKVLLCHFDGQGNAHVIEVSVKAETAHVNNHFDCLASPATGCEVGQSCSCAGETLQGDLQIICNYLGVVEVLGDIDMLFDDECSVDINLVDIGDGCSCL